MWKLDRLGRSLRELIAMLDDLAIPPAELFRQVKLWYDSLSTGGTTIDADGNIYINDTSEKRLLKVTPAGKASTVLQDPCLVWGDAMWIDNDGFVWIPSPQVNRTPEFNKGKSVVEFPVHLYKLKLDVRPLRD